MIKKYQIFVSSTKEDLEDERKAIYETILELGHIPTGMEWFPSSDMSQWEYIKKQLEMTDYVVLISAGMYGSIVPGEKISWTEKEFDYCKENNIPVLSFLYEDIGKLEYQKVERIHREKLELFREKLGNNCIRKTYNDSDDLIKKVGTTLSQNFENNPRDGWVRASVA